MVKNKKAVTLVELIVTMTAISIIALAAGTVLIYLWQEFLYLPKQLKVSQVGQTLLDEIIEGTASARGLRFAKAISDATASQVNYTYGYPAAADTHSVILRWDDPAKLVYRSIDGSAETAIPYYSTGTNVRGKVTPAVIFTYYKADGSAWISGVDAVSAVKRVQVDINMATGTGLFAGYEGSLDMSSSVEIKQ